MAVTTTPLWIQGLATHQSQDYRRFLEGLMGFKHGIFEAGDLAVTSNGTMTVTVARGTCLVDGSEDANQGMYFVHNDAAQNITAATAHATLTRFDMVVIRVRDNFYATGPTDAADLFIVQGTPASSPAEPAIPPNCLVLARLTVTFNDVVISAADIADRRTSTAGQHRITTLGGIRAVTNPTRPTLNLKPHSDVILETDTGNAYVWDGANWLFIFSVGSAIAPSWTNPTLLNSWANFGAPFQTAQYRKIGDMVQLRGLIAGGTLGTNAFVLPSGFRPNAELIFASIQSSTANVGRVRILSTGGVVPSTSTDTPGATNAFCSFDTVQFSVTV